MIRHVVMWTFKEEAEGRTAEENMLFVRDSLYDLLPVIPEIKKMEINIFISISYQVRVTDCLISKKSHGKHVHPMKEFLVILTAMTFKDK